MPHRPFSKEKTKSGAPSLPRTCGKFMGTESGVDSSAGGDANDRAPSQLMS